MPRDYSGDFCSDKRRASPGRPAFPLSETKPPGSGDERRRNGFAASSSYPLYRLYNGVFQAWNASRIPENGTECEETPETRLPWDSSDSDFASRARLRKWLRLLYTSLEHRQPHACTHTRICAVTQPQRDTPLRNLVSGIRSETATAPNFIYCRNNGAAVRSHSIVTRERVLLLSQWLSHKHVIIAYLMKTRRKSRLIIFSHHYCSHK